MKVYQLCLSVLLLTSVVLSDSIEGITITQSFEAEEMQQNDLSDMEKTVIADLLTELENQFDEELLEQVYDNSANFKKLIVYEDLLFEEPDFSEAIKLKSSEPSSDRSLYSNIQVDVNFSFWILLGNQETHDLINAVYAISDLQIEYQTKPLSKYGLHVNKGKITVLDENLVVDGELIAKMEAFLKNYFEGLIMENKRNLQEEKDELSDDEEEALADFYILVEDLYIQKFENGDFTKLSPTDLDIFDTLEELKRKTEEDTDLLPPTEEHLEGKLTKEDPTVEIKNLERVPVPETWSEETKDRYKKTLKKIKDKVFKWEHVSVHKLKEIEKKHSWVKDVEKGVVDVEHDLEKVAQKAANKFKKWVGGD